MEVPVHTVAIGAPLSSIVGKRTESPGAYTSTHRPHAVRGVRSSRHGPVGLARLRLDAPTTRVPAALAGETAHASMSRLPADATTSMPASRSIATALSIAGTVRCVSTTNDQFTTAGRSGCHR